MLLAVEAGSTRLTRSGRSVPEGTLNSVDAAAVEHPHRQVAAGADIERAGHLREIRSAGMIASACSGGEVRLRVCLAKVSIMDVPGLWRAAGDATGGPRRP